ncbi:MAG: 5'-methylthioadenosine/S-adenosylhomocysteine nucleosidase [Anaerolineales bacterium]|nr:5'-methylthioadenosine/S-adenosylhomocysteine nucleosidase [Anaerolineales bacterium]
MNIVVIISANAEWRAVRELYPHLQLQQSPFGEYADLTLDTRRLTLFHGGWGKISAAASAQFVIDHFKPDLLINLGTCGGFAGRIQTGAVILVERVIVYDILEQMTDSREAIEYYSTEIDLSWLGDDLPDAAVKGLLVSADRDIVIEDIPMLIQTYGASAADWESGAIAWVAKRNGTRLLILRGVSDLVGGAGGEAYGNYDLFAARTKEVMRRLFEMLPGFIV